MKEKLKKKERGAPERAVVRRFTNKEAYEFLKDLITKHRFHKDLYIMFGLWLTSLLHKRQFSYLKELCGGSINTIDFYSNRVEYQELIQDIILELITFKKNPDGTIRGLVTKISWDKIPIINKTTKVIMRWDPLEGNHGKIVAFIKGAFVNCLYKCLAKSYRGDVNYSNLYTTKKKSKDKETELSRLRERMTDETDTSITTPELISKLKLEGYSDVCMFQYRYVYSLGNHKAFTELTEEIITKASVIKEMKELSSSDKFKQFVYDAIFNILNSKLLPKLNREFLKCYYNIPTLITFWEVKKFYNNDMIMFYEQFPEYRQVLKVKRVSYAGGRRIVSSSDKDNIIIQSQIYKESHSMLKDALLPELEKIKDSYSSSITDVQNLIAGLNGMTHIQGNNETENFLEYVDFAEEVFSDD